MVTTNLIVVYGRYRLKRSQEAKTFFVTKSENISLIQFIYKDNNHYLILKWIFVKIQRVNCTVFHKVYSSGKKIKMPPLCVKTFEITNDKVPSDETIFLTKIMRLFIEACFITWNCICDMLVVFQYMKSMFWVPKKY